MAAATTTEASSAANSGQSSGLVWSGLVTDERVVNKIIKYDPALLDDDYGANQSPGQYKFQFRGSNLENAKSITNASNLVPDKAVAMEVKQTKPASAADGSTASPSTPQSSESHEARGSQGPSVLLFVLVNGGDKAEEEEQPASGARGAGHPHREGHEVP